MDPNQKNPDHNLVNQARASRLSSRVLIVYVFRALPIISAALFGIGYRWYLDDKINLFPILLLLGLYLITSGILTLVTKNAGVRNKLLFLEIVALILPFIDWPPLALFVTFILLLIFFSWGISRARYELYGSTEINFFKIIHPHLGKMVTGLTFMTLILYMPKWDAKDILVSETGFQKFFGSTSEIVNNFYPEVNFTSTSTIGSLAQDLISSRLKKDKIFQNLPESAQELAIQVAVNDFFVNTIQKNFNPEARVDDPATRFFYNSIIVRMNSWKDRFGVTFSVIWAIIMFFLIRGLGGIVSFISTGILFVIYHILLSTNVLRIGTEMRPVETLELV